MIFLTKKIPRVPGNVGRVTLWNVRHYPKKKWGDKNFMSMSDIIDSIDSIYIIDNFIFRGGVPARGRTRTSTRTHADGNLNWGKWVMDKSHWKKKFPFRPSTNKWHKFLLSNVGEQKFSLLSVVSVRSVHGHSYCESLWEPTAVLHLPSFALLEGILQGSKMSDIFPRHWQIGHTPQGKFFAGTTFGGKLFAVPTFLRLYPSGVAVLNCLEQLP